MESNNKKKDTPSGLFLVGFLFIGMALGMLTGYMAVGTMAGLGLGFIAMAVVRMSK